MDENFLQVKTEERQNFIKVFDNEELDICPNNLQETTNVTQAQQPSSNTLYDNINVPCTYNYIDDISQQAQENIISGPYVHVPISSYMSQNTDHHIHDI